MDSPALLQLLLIAPLAREPCHQIFSRPRPDTHLECFYTSDGGPVNVLIHSVCLVSLLLIAKQPNRSSRSLGCVRVCVEAREIGFTRFRRYDIQMISSQMRDGRDRLAPDINCLLVGTLSRHLRESFVAALVGASDGWRVTTPPDVTRSDDIVNISWAFVYKWI